ncbi:unnamed protein product [Cochlearia groenlandica]
MIITKSLITNALSFFFVINSLLVLQVFAYYDQELNTTSSSSAWLKSHTKSLTISNFNKRKPHFCKPRACKRSGPPVNRMRCCRNHCVDVLTDPNHCKFCFKKCRFGLVCCRGRCVDTNKDHNNCGKCGYKCGIGAPCEFGMCGYASPSTSRPRKHRHRHHHRKKAHRPCPPSSSPDSHGGGGKIYDD